LNSILNIDGLNLQLGHRTILKQVSFTWSEAIPCIGVFGKNGAGKSSLFKCLLGQELRYRGSMSLFGHKLDALNLRERRNLGLAGLNQEASLFWDMTVWDNLLTITEFLRCPSPSALIDSVLIRMGLQTLAQQKASTLSGGEQRRLEIARLLLHTPKLIVLDEPFAGLDAMAIQNLVHILKGLMQENVKVMLSDHQIHPLLACSDHILWLDDGQLLCLEPNALFLERNEIKALV